MNKTRKVMELHDGKYQFVCIKREGDNCNPYRLYNVYWNDGGWHRKQIAKYCNMESVVAHIGQIMGVVRI